MMMALGLAIQWQHNHAWKVVCDEKGHYNFTWGSGIVNRYFEPYDSYEEAREKMEFFKRNDVRQPSPAPHYDYKICPRQ